MERHAEVPIRACHRFFGTCSGQSSGLDADTVVAFVASWVEQLSPLYHGVALVRASSLGEWSLSLVAPAGVLVGLTGPVDEADIERASRVLQISREAVVDAQWADNGPGWIAVKLATAAEVLAIDPDFSAVESYDIGVVGPNPIGIVGGDAVTCISGAVAL